MLHLTVLDKGEKEILLRELSAVFHLNMAVFLEGGDSEQAQNHWIREVSDALTKENRQILLCAAGQTLAGFLMYYVRGDMVMIEEIQIRDEYRFSGVFSGLCKFLAASLPGNIGTIEAYAHKGNRRSIDIMGKLGMTPVPKEDASPFVHMQGKIDASPTLSRIIK